MLKRLPLAVPSPSSVHTPARLFRIAALTLPLSIFGVLAGLPPASAQLPSVSRNIGIAY